MHAINYGLGNTLNVMFCKGNGLPIPLFIARKAPEAVVEDYFQVWVPSWFEECPAYAFSRVLRHVSLVLWVFGILDHPHLSSAVVAFAFFRVEWVVVH